MSTLEVALAAASSSAIGLVLKVAKKVIDNPNEPKFRSLNTTTAGFANMAAGGGDKLLAALGFTLDAVPTGGGSARLVLPHTSIEGAAADSLTLAVAHLERELSSRRELESGTSAPFATTSTASPSATAAVTSNERDPTDGSGRMEEEDDDEALLAQALALSQEHATASTRSIESTTSAEMETSASDSNGAPVNGSNDAVEDDLALALALSTDTASGHDEGREMNDGDAEGYGDSGDLERALKLSRQSPEDPSLLKPSEGAPNCSSSHSPNDTTGGGGTIKEAKVGAGTGEPETFAAKVQRLFEAAVARGEPPNDAAASALAQAHKEQHALDHTAQAAAKAAPAAAPLDETTASGGGAGAGRLAPAPTISAPDPILTPEGFQARVAALYQEEAEKEALALSVNDGTDGGAAAGAADTNSGGNNNANNAALRAIERARSEQLVAAAAAAKEQDEAHRAADSSADQDSDASSLVPPTLVRTLSAPAPSFERSSSASLSVAEEQLEAINALFRTDGVSFVDDQFPPLDRSLYASTLTATTWACRACSARNPLPNGGRPHTRDELIALMFPGRTGGGSSGGGDSSSGGSSGGSGGGGSNVAAQQRTLACQSCGAHSAELEVAMRPSHWMHPSFLVDDVTMQTSTVPWVVFRGQPEPEDIRQGGVGNCWLVCALSVLAERPDVIKRIVLTQEHNPAGAYQVRLCRAGQWHTLTIDDTFPVNALSMLAYLKAARRSLWGPLIEKAAAKLHGSYEALAGGTFAEAFAMLTGYPVNKHWLGKLVEPPRSAYVEGEAGDAAHAKKVAEWREEHGSVEEARQALFAQLYSYKESGFAIGACTHVGPDQGGGGGSGMNGGESAQQREATLRGVGLQVPHAYGVLGVMQLDADPSVDFLDYEPSAASSSSAANATKSSPFGPLGGAPTLQLVKLRNPNGHAGWKGPWSYTCGAGGTFHSDDVRWTRSRRAALKLGADDGGVFWMGWPEFCDYFAELTVCRLLDDGMPEAREQGWLASAFNAGQGVAIENYARTRVELCAYQEVSAQRGESAMRTMIDIGLVVLKCPVATVDEAAAAASSPRGSSNGDSGRSAPRSYGTLVEHAERVLHGEGAHVALTLEQDDYATRYLALPLCFGHLRSTEPRKFTLAVHSEAPVSVEVVPVDAGLLGAAVIALVVAQGEKTPVLTNRFTQQPMLVLYFLKDDAGLVVVAENACANESVQLEFDASEHTVNYTSSRSARGLLLSTDVLPPRSRMLVTVLSADLTKKYHKLGYGINASVLSPDELSFAQGAGGQHLPSLAELDELALLHEPQPMEIDSGSAPSLVAPTGNAAQPPLSVELLSGILNRLQPQPPP